MQDRIAEQQINVVARERANALDVTLEPSHALDRDAEAAE